jgi:hypothetical protein
MEIELRFSLSVSMNTINGALDFFQSKGFYIVGLTREFDTLVYKFKDTRENKSCKTCG